MLLKRIKEDIKNVDHMWSIDIATVREFMFCKVKVWKDYFWNWLRKHWPTLTNSPHHWTIIKYCIPLFVPPTRISEKIPPINMSRLQRCQFLKIKVGEMQIQQASQPVILSPLMKSRDENPESFCYLAPVLYWKVLFEDQTLGWIKVFLFSNL